MQVLLRNITSWRSDRYVCRTSYISMIPLIGYVIGGYIFFFFFQAEDGIRDIGVTGVQTCALPICGCAPSRPGRSGRRGDRSPRSCPGRHGVDALDDAVELLLREAGEDRQRHDLLGGAVGLRQLPVTHRPVLGQVRPQLVDRGRVVDGVADAQLRQPGLERVPVAL